MLVKFTKRQSAGQSTALSLTSQRFLLHLPLTSSSANRSCSSPPALLRQQRISPPSAARYPAYLAQQLPPQLCIAGVIDDEQIFATPSHTVIELVLVHSSRAKAFPSPRRCGKPSWCWRSRPTTLSFLTPSRFYHLVNDDAAAPHPLVALCPALREAPPVRRSSGRTLVKQPLLKLLARQADGERMIRAVPGRSSGDVVRKSVCSREHL